METYEWLVLGILLAVVVGLFALAFDASKDSARDNQFVVACAKAGGDAMRLNGSLVCVADPKFLDIRR